MNLKNLSVKNKTRSQILEYLNKKKISRIYKKFAASLQVEENLAVAVSGGPDSLALVALTKAYSYTKKTKFHYVLVDHNIRKNSAKEANQVKNLLKKNKINLNILINKKKIKRNIQSLARNTRYEILSKYCIKNNIT